VRENVDDGVDAVKRSARRVDEFRNVRRDAHVPDERRAGDLRTIVVSRSKDRDSLA
jgi:hypothetical protein